MTTEAATKLYLAQHQYEMQGKRVAIYNPNNKPIDELPVIYGFNNGGKPGWFYGQLLAEDGTGLGGHICSHEGYMLHDLGILEGTRPDRHERFMKHYPDGYRMLFVGIKDVKTNEGLLQAYKLNQGQREHKTKAQS